MSSASFAGRVVLVTGASSGLGAACVRRFAAAGASVYAAARDQARLAEVAASCAELPGEVAFGPLDVAVPASCREAVAAAVEVFGRLDVLVNNAGRHDFRLTAEVTEEQWAHDVAVNLGGAFFCSQAAIPHLLETAGNIVNVASVAGVVGEAYSAAYTAAKHGVVGLTKALAVEHVKAPLRVNCVCPGGMDTPQVHTIEVPEGADFELVMRISAARGFMSADSVAAVVAFLASDDAAAVHGSVQVVDHGHLAG
ncbi:SDR family NAD(P)-dependent oxidoreductase [Nocardioides lianchengensis]|uniref:NAD(P)-dependent dehydrogenase, short-chain alcohol dehydrogenase family n=1 Tax=Nocardioides lianchengensis TaxID=1045774 RepID=A0A1G6VWK5_9ACTN|nr:SDR family NAD(P)-dependent oxidoreductase [Nocardioides lianchengensis]NYG11320.1 NAD(P)-dependent dehydrogenase (short-subunit alcohol dehydrogenase family) [Nocardioides lianchengensis]SDD57894.1 NAD(P)-dependent dehydrogenase, short-chain alcohol dehydrogenase family [Nocardioides lianchengensis]